ncbi:MAG: hypothetical protein H6744_00805 [Deltaproteobacteria bacterium]|nr:hypothetical protein [Deltaproteobacteria bacterium]MCB9785205.1 hypothetical protein [Deltaproteobacteria bacterium]
MSARTRGVVLVCSLAAALLAVMFTLEQGADEPGGSPRETAQSSGHRDASAGGAGADALADALVAAAADGGPSLDDPGAVAAPPTANDEPAAPEEAPRPGPVVEIATPDEGPLFVSGSGVEGLTPQRTAPLTPGVHRLRLVGGAGAPPVVVILDSDPPRLDATLSGEGREKLDITCRGGITGPEPLTTPVGARLLCWVHGPQGTLPIELRVVGR